MTQKKVWNCNVVCCDAVGGKSWLWSWMRQEGIWGFITGEEKAPPWKCRWSPKRRQVQPPCELSIWAPSIPRRLLAWAPGTKWSKSLGKSCTDFMRPFFFFCEKFVWSSVDHHFSESLGKLTRFSIFSSFIGLLHFFLAPIKQYFLHVQNSCEFNKTLLLIFYFL
jgi:hypothetical protein